MDLGFLTQSISHELQALETSLLRECTSHVPLVNAVAEHILKSSGKRIRPTLLILSALAQGYRGEEHIKMATVIEYIHTATLLHDDVVDCSQMRRGQAAAHTRWGNEASILVGDYLYAKAFSLLVEINKPRTLQTLSQSTQIIAEAEAMQLEQRFQSSLSETQYIQIIHGKTGQLFGLSMSLGGLLTDCDDETAQGLHAYGIHLGTAFQLVDDALDYCATLDEMGKNQGDDLSCGSPTLPPIYAMRNGSREHANMVKESISSGRYGKFEEITQILNETGAIDYTLAKAKSQAEIAKNTLRAILPESQYREQLIWLADFAVARKH